MGKGNTDLSQPKTFLSTSCLCAPVFMAELGKWDSLMETVTDAYVHQHKQRCHNDAGGSIIATVMESSW